MAAESTGALPHNRPDSRALRPATWRDPKTGTFTPTGSMKTARLGHTATLLADGRVLLAGGYDSRTLLTYASAELFDPKTGAFTATGSMATPRADATATPLADGRVLLAGGFDTKTRQVFESAELYDPKTGTFSATGSMTAKRFFHGATALQDGRVLVVGGYSAPYSSGCTSCAGILASLEVFDTKTGAYSTTGSMADGQNGHIATLLQDGLVLVTGGHDASGNSTAAAEVFDPATGAFGPTGAMATPRSGYTVTQLSDGRVLVVGAWTMTSRRSLRRKSTSPEDRWCRASEAASSAPSV
jgi:hypothetical protein